MSAAWPLHSLLSVCKARATVTGRVVKSIGVKFDGFPREGGVGTSWQWGQSISCKEDNPIRQNAEVVSNEMDD